MNNINDNTYACRGRSKETIYRNRTMIWRRRKKTTIINKYVDKAYRSIVDPLASIACHRNKNDIVYVWWKQLVSLKMYIYCL